LVISVIVIFVLLSVDVAEARNAHDHEQDSEPNHDGLGSGHQRLESGKHLCVAVERRVRVGGAVGAGHGLAVSGGLGVEDAVGQRVGGQLGGQVGRVVLEGGLGPEPAEACATEHLFEVRQGGGRHQVLGRGLVRAVPVAEAHAAHVVGGCVGVVGAIQGNQVRAPRVAGAAYFIVVTDPVPGLGFGSLHPGLLLGVLVVVAEALVALHGANDALEVAAQDGSRNEDDQAEDTVEDAQDLLEQLALAVAAAQREAVGHEKHQQDAGDCDQRVGQRA